MSTTPPLTLDGQSATAIATRCGLPRVELHAEVESTQNVAHALAERGAPAGTLVVADAQRTGRGRQGRSWSSQPGRGIWCTVLERPRNPRSLDVLSIRVGLLLAESLDDFAGAPVGVKWPNDLMVRSEKLGGILAEARWSGGVLGWVAIGVGVNVLPPSDVASTVGLRSGVGRPDVLAAVVGAVRAAAAAEGHLTREEMDRYRVRDVLVNRRVASPAVGIVTGVAADGALIVETARGTERCRAGTVRFAGDA